MLLTLLLVGVYCGLTTGSRESQSGNWGMQSLRLLLLGHRVNFYAILPLVRWVGLIVSLRLLCRMSRVTIELQLF